MILSAGSQWTLMVIFRPRRLKVPVLGGHGLVTHRERQPGMGQPLKTDLFAAHITTPSTIASAQQKVTIKDQASPLFPRPLLRHRSIENSDAGCVTG
jgi:hypothetical protein